MPRIKQCPICGAEEDDQMVRSADAELKRRFKLERELIISNIEKMRIPAAKRIIDMIRRTMK